MDHENPITGQFMAPVGRLSQATESFAGKAWTVVWSGIQIVWNDFFAVSVIILLLAHGYDWIYGRQVAKARGEFDPTISALGLNSKIASLVIVFLVRLLESVLATQGLVETHGLFAVGIAATLIYQDIQSIEDKRVETGATPIPVLSPVLQYLEAFTERLIPHRDSRTRPPGGDPDADD